MAAPVVRVVVDMTLEVKAIDEALEGMLETPDETRDDESAVEYEEEE